MPLIILFKDVPLTFANLFHSPYQLNGNDFIVCSVDIENMRVHLLDLLEVFFSFVNKVLQTSIFSSLPLRNVFVFKRSAGEPVH